MSIVLGTVDVLSIDKEAPSGMKRRTFPATLPNANLVTPGELLIR
jgi:hypothetical protein